MDTMQKTRMFAEANTDKCAVELCEDLLKTLAALTALTKDEDSRTAIEVYQVALRAVIRSAKEHL